MRENFLDFRAGFALAFGVDLVGFDVDFFRFRVMRRWGFGSDFDDCERVYRVDLDGSVCFGSLFRVELEEFPYDLQEALLFFYLGLACVSVEVFLLLFFPPFLCSLFVI